MQQHQKAQYVQRFSQLSDLTSKQQESLSRLSRILDEQQLPPHLQAHKDEPKEGEEVDKEPLIEGNPPLIDTMSQFYKWFDSIETSAHNSVSQLSNNANDDNITNITNNTNNNNLSTAIIISSEYPRLHDPSSFGESRTLQGYASEVGRVQELACEWTRLVHETTDHCIHVRERASNIHERACAMSATQAENELLATALETRIKYFDQLYPLTRKLYTPSASLAGGEGLSTVLSELDECIEFMQTHRSYKEAEAYLTKYRQLQARALTSLKTHIIDSLRAATTAIEQQEQLAASQAASAQRMRSAPSSSSRQQVLAQQQLAMQAQGKRGKMPRLLPEALDSAPIALQFRILAARLRPHCAELEKRALGKDLGALLGDCHSSYFHYRKMLLQGRVQETLAWLAADDGDLSEAVRSAAGFALQVCRVEIALFGMFFQSKTPLVAKLVESVAQSLEFVLRPMVIRAKCMDVLCAAAAALRDDSLAEKMDTDELKPLAKTLLALAKDGQERITYLAQREIRDEIAFFTPSDEDINYPNRLIELQSRPASNPSGDDQADLLEAVQRMYATWYPSLQKTLMLLSKIYLTVDVLLYYNKY